MASNRYHKEAIALIAADRSPEELKSILVRIAQDHPAVFIKAANNVFSREWDVLLVSYPAHLKIKLIKAVREATGAGLGEAKALIERPLPVHVFTAGSRRKADDFVRELKRQGAVFKIEQA